MYQDNDRIQGHCVRRAPRPSVNLDEEPYAAWPAVVRDDWCGEWADGSITPEQEERRESVRQFAVAIVSAGLGQHFTDQEVWCMAKRLADSEPRGDK